MTRLIELLNENKIFPQNWSRVEDVNQESIDAIAHDLENQLSAHDIAEHNIKAYNDSVQEYTDKPSNRLVVPEITDFINTLSEDSVVLDLGCGHGRDSLYFAKPEVRDSLNREGMSSPDTRLKVVPLDGSQIFLRATYNSLREHNALSQVPLMVKADFSKKEFSFPYSNSFELEQRFVGGELCDAIWACTSLFIHSEPEELEENIKFWGGKLHKGGVFAGSYIRSQETGRRFLASRSAPGEIKVFTHFSDEDIERAFHNCGFTNLANSRGDYAGRGSNQKDFFGNVLYQKE